jgi:hypothetical protein
LITSTSSYHILFLLLTRDTVMNKRDKVSTLSSLTLYWENRHFLCGPLSFIAFLPMRILIPLHGIPQPSFLPSNQLIHYFWSKFLYENHPLLPQVDLNASFPVFPQTWYIINLLMVRVYYNEEKHVIFFPVTRRALHLAPNYQICAI